MSEQTSPAPWRQTLILYSTMAGMCKFIPIPFVDDIVQGFVVRRMIRVLLAEHGIVADTEALERLTRERPGCPLGCIYTLVLYPIKKILKKILFFLAFKDFADESSKWFHRGYLVQYAAQAELLTARTMTSEHLQWPVALAIEETLQETDTKRFTQIIRRAWSGSRASLRAVSRRLWRLVGAVRRQPDAEEAVGTALQQVEAEHGELDSDLESFSQTVWRESDHLVAMEQRFVDKLAETHRRYQKGRAAIEGAAEPSTPPPAPAEE